LSRGVLWLQTLWSGKCGNSYTELPNADTAR
jgi:hypothetical protein